QRAPAVEQRVGERARIAQHLCRVAPERRLRRLLQRHRDRRDHIHVRPALQAGKDGLIDDRSMLLAAQHQAGARAAQAAGRGGGGGGGGRRLWGGGGGRTSTRGRRGWRTPRAAIRPPTCEPSAMVPAPPSSAIALKAS